MLLNYGDCAKMCFRGVLKPQMLKYAGGYTLKPQKRRIVRLVTGRGENSMVF